MLFRRRKKKGKKVIATIKNSTKEPFLKAHDGKKCVVLADKGNSFFLVKSFHGNELLQLAEHELAV